MWIEKPNIPLEIDQNSTISSVKYRISEWVFRRLTVVNSLEQKKDEIEKITDILELVTLCEELREEMEQRWLPYIPDHVTWNAYAWFMHHVYQPFSKRPQCPRTKKIYVNGKKCFVWKVFKYKRKSFIRFACFMIDAIYEDDFKKYYSSFYTV